jgi:hypothetical protein
VATVAAGGLASGLTAGTSTISAQVGGVAGSTVLTVAAPGVVWTVRAGVASPINTLYAVASSGSQFAAVAPGTIMTSPDGVTWTSQPTDGNYYLRGVTWNGGQFDAVGYSNNLAEPMSLYSSDGVSWTGYGWTPTAPFPANPVPLAIAWTNWGGVVVGTSGTLWLSPSPQAFNQRTNPTGATLYAATGSPSVIVVVGAGGTVLTSTDGTTFTARASGTANDLNGVAWTGNLFVAVGDAGTVVTSPDGITWTGRASGTGSILRAAASSGTLTVAVGDAGTVVTSTDGVTWSPGVLPGNLPSTSNNLYGVAWSGHQFAAVGGAANGLVLSSP